MSKNKSRKVKKPAKSWKTLFMYFVPVFIIAVVLVNHLSGGRVLGVSDKNLVNKTKEKPAISSEMKCTGRISAFSVSGLCDSGKNGFKTYSYTCEDGKTGSVTSATCMNIQSAFEKSLKACGIKCGNREEFKQTNTSPKPTGL